MAHHLEYTFRGSDNPIFLGGWLPVDGFFVLSGFLLGGALMGEWERNGRIHYGRFVLRRFFRLYPALFVVIVTMTAFMLAVDHLSWTEVWPSIAGSGLYVFNLLYSTHRPQVYLAGHLWSLSVEFQFYLLLPLLVGGLYRVRASRPVWLLTVALIAIASAASRHVLGVRYLPEIYLDLPFRLDSLMWGVMAALLVRWAWVGVQTRTVLRILGPMAAVVLGYLYFTQGGFDPPVYAWGIAASSLASMVLVLWVFVDQTSVFSHVLGSKPFVAAGARSYSAYLWHFPIFYRAGSPSAGPQRMVSIFARPHGHGVGR